MNYFRLDDFPLGEKTVLVRVDFNEGISGKKVEDNEKIRAALPTIKFLLSKRCKIVLMTHLGRPKGKVVEKYRVQPLVTELKRLLPGKKITYLRNCIGKTVKGQIERGKGGEIFFLENLRFYSEEEKNDDLFAQSLASLAEVYVNDAFAVVHRKHASVHAITKYLPAVVGRLLEKEINHLGKALRPKRPAVWIIGGAKLQKVGLIEEAFRKADYVLLGGALAFSFMKAKGMNVGMSKVDVDSIRIARKLLKKRAARKIILPKDFVVATSITRGIRTRTVGTREIGKDEIGLDLGEETVKDFKRYLRGAHTVVWNGPLGYFELMQFAHATREIGRFLGKLTAVTICGGGETAAAIKKFHLEHKITHLSTGGGASLAFLSGEKLPSLSALEKNYKKYGKTLRKAGFVRKRKRRLRRML